MSVIKKETIDVRRIETALIGGDFTGNARGTNAVDIQADRTAATQVASGAQSTAIGYANTASDTRTTAIGAENVASQNDATAIGYSNTASGFYSSAIGYDNESKGNYSTAVGSSNVVDNGIAFGNNNDVDTGGGTDEAIALGISNTSAGYHTLAVGRGNTADDTAWACSAIGYGCTASGNYTNAIGYQAEARIRKTTNICGPQIIRKDNGEAAGNAFESFCGTEVILMSKEVDLKAVADQTITLPANCHIWLNEVGIIATNIAGLVAQPTVRYGITGDLDKHGAAAATTALTATNKREIETPLVPEDGETSLTGGVTIAANADTFNGRFYWKGMLVEDE